MATKVAIFSTHIGVDGNGGPEKEDQKSNNSRKSENAGTENAGPSFLFSYSAI